MIHQCTWDGEVVMTNDRLSFLLKAEGFDGQIDDQVKAFVESLGYDSSVVDGYYAWKVDTGAVHTGFDTEYNGTLTVGNNGADRYGFSAAWAGSACNPSRWTDNSIPYDVAINRLECRSQNGGNTGYVSLTMGGSQQVDGRDTVTATFNGFSVDMTWTGTLYLSPTDATGGDIWDFLVANDGMAVQMDLGAFDA